MKEVRWVASLRAGRGRFIEVYVLFWYCGGCFLELLVGGLFAVGV